jgi:hypothetical protein
MFRHVGLDAKRLAESVSTAGCRRSGSIGKRRTANGLYNACKHDGGYFVQKGVVSTNCRVFHVYDNIEADIGHSAPKSAAIASTSCRGINRFTCEPIDGRREFVDIVRVNLKSIGFPASSQDLQFSLKMSLQRSCRLLSQRTVFQTSRRHVFARRCMSTATAGAADTSTLPLAGIKVLDMTRVLAGVSGHTHSSHGFANPN